MKSNGAAVPLRGLKLSTQSIFRNTASGQTIALVLGLTGGSRRTPVGAPFDNGQLALSNVDGRVVLLVGPNGLPEAPTSALDFTIEEHHPASSTPRRVSSFSLALEEPPIIPAPPVIVNPGTISGTRGTGNVITGTAALANGTPAPSITYQWQAYNGSWGNIVGATGQNYTDTALTQNLNLRRQVTATNASGTASGDTNSLSGNSGSAYDRLVTLSGGQTNDANVWLDTATSGQTLATIQNMMIGATYSARLFTQPNWVQPPANAVTIVGNQIRAGAGYASVYPATYVLEIVNETTGFTTHALIDVLSNRAANVTVSTPAALIGALDTAKAKLIAEGASYTGYVIDVAPGIDYGDIRYNLGKPNTSQTRQTIIRNADPNRVNPASRPKFQHLSVYNCRYPVFQRLLLETGNLQINPLSACRNVTTLDGTSTTIDFPYYVGNRARGGELVYTGAGGAFIDHTRTIDPANNFHEGYTYFRWVIDTTGGNTLFNRMDLFVGHSAALEQGAAVGVWSVATTPAFVGANTPNGQAGIFGAPGSGHWLANNWTSTAPPAFDAQWEVAYLDSTPRNTTYGGPNRVKPAGGPDGNYIVAWRLNGSAADRTWTGASLGGNGAIRWLNQNTYYVGESKLPTAFLANSNGRFRHMIFSRNHISEVGEGIYQYEIVEMDHCLWTVNNFAEMFARDSFQSIWSASPPYNNPQIWNPGFGHFHAFNFFGRAIVREDDFNQPHGDTLQGFDNTSYYGAGGRAQPYYLLVGNIQFTKTGRNGAGIQGPFLSDLGDLTPPLDLTDPSGYRVVSIGNFIDANEPNAWALARLQVDLSAYNSVMSVYGSGAERYTLDPAWPPAIHYQKITFGVLHTQSLAEFGSFDKRYIDGRLALASTPGVWANPDQTFTSDIPTLRARYTAIGANAGYGAFADSEQVIDHTAKVWNPNIHEFRLLSNPALNVAVSTWTPSTPRQILYGTRPKQVSVSGGEWSKGATRAAALAAARTASPGTILPGEWIVFWVQSSSFNTFGKSGTLTVDGVDSVFTTRTEVGPNLGPLEPGLEPLLVGTPAVTGQSGGDAATFNAVASVSVPDGGMILAFVATDGNQEISIIGADTDWETLANQVVPTNNFEGTIYRWRNRTGGAVSKSLQLGTPTGEQWACVSYVFNRATAGFGVECALALGPHANITNPNPPFLALDANRRFFGICGTFASASNGISATPAGFPTIAQRIGSANSNGVTTSTCYGTGLTGNSLDPGELTLSGLGSPFPFTVAVWEQAL